MYTRKWIRYTALTTLCLTTSYLTGCSPPPPVISADLSCIWTKNIDVTPWQVDDMKKDPNQWRPLAIQIKDHNDERVKRCPPVKEK